MSPLPGGAIAANGMFALTAVSVSTHHRASPADAWLRDHRLTVIAHEPQPQAP